MHNYPLDASLTLAEAAPQWLEEHCRYFKPNTIRSYKCALKPLNLFFGEIVLTNIHIGLVRSYQQERKKKAGAYLLNGELSVLQMILKEAGHWKNIQEFYRPLPVPKRRGGHSLSAEEEQRLRNIAFSRPKWRLAAHCIMVMLSTTMGFGELRYVRRRDVDMKRRCIVVREGAKNDYRDRTIPLNSSAFESLCWILDRWEDLGGKHEEQYILPHRPRSPKGPWLLDEPMTAIRSAFRSIRKAAGLSHFRVYDCRVQAITKLLSNPAVSPQVSKEIAGHISQAMQDRYSIQQFDTKMAALEALESPSSVSLDVIGQTVPELPPSTLMNPAIQAEIARQVALALRSNPTAPQAPEPAQQATVYPRQTTGLITFPGPSWGLAR